MHDDGPDRKTTDRRCDHLPYHARMGVEIGARRCAEAMVGGPYLTGSPTADRLWHFNDCLAPGRSIQTDDNVLFEPSAPVS